MVQRHAERCDCLDISGSSPFYKTGSAVLTTFAVQLLKFFKHP
jgi:hypothetical protein